MKILLVRHAIAEGKVRFARTGRPDAERPLTGEGRRKMKQAARGIKCLVPNLAVVTSSPWKRAVQTADILTSAYGTKRVLVDPCLRPGGAFSKRLRWIAALKSPLVAVVGHEPDLGRFASWLLTGRSGNWIEIKKGGALLIEAGKGLKARGRLAWSMPPRILRQIGKS